MKFRMKKEAGFSLVELMVVVGIIGILAAIAAPKLQRFSAKAKQAEAQSTLSTVDTFQQAYFAENSTYASFATIGYTNLSGTKNYSAPAVSGTPAATYSVTMSSRGKLCAASTNANDVWSVNEKTEITNSTSGLTGC